MPLRLKLFFVLALLTSIPLLVLLFGVVDRMESEVEARTEIELHTTLDKMADELDIIIKNQKAIANGLARVPVIKEFASMAHQNYQSGRPHANYDKQAEQLENFFLNYQYSVPSIQAIRFIDSRGKTLVKVKEGKPIIPKRVEEQTGRLFIADQSNRPFFKDALYTQKSVVMSDFELGQVSAGADFCPAMVRYSVPIRDELDNTEAVLVVNVWGKQLDATMQTALGGYPGLAYIVELSDDTIRDGIYLYHHDNDKRFADQVKTDYRFSSELQPEEWQSVHNAPLYGSIFKDSGRMLFYRKMSPYDNRDTKWLLVIETDRDTLFAPIINMRNSIWLLLVVLLVISLLIAVWASGWLAKPIHNLADIIKRFADGERGARYQAVGHDEIGHAGRAFNYLAANLEHTEKEREKAVKAACQSERLAALGQLAAGIGHEINNPLTNIMSLATLVGESVGDDNKEIKADIDVMKKEGQRCARIVQGILNFARESEPTYEEFDMAALLDETLQLLQHRIESADITLHTQIKSPLIMQGDKNLLQQVFVNILLNAIQATPAGSSIFIQADIKQGEVVIEVLDQGRGIDAKSASKIFDPFFTTKPEGEGTGLGLSVSYGIINKHGGSIQIDNTDNAGASVLIRLPLEDKRKAPREDVEKEVMEAANVG
ncbi:MAG: sensor histidine kinase [Thioalkalispiraceae bacterium]